jgi:SAM-dependent methyltransferase
VIFADRQFIDADERVYEHYHDHAPFLTPPTVQASLESIVRFSDRFRSTGRWLDFGFGEGALLEVAQRYGWQCYGVEISPRALKNGQERGWTVTPDPSSDERFCKACFDVMTMVELLEHLPAPLALLNDAARWLRPGGLLYITTPNARSLNRRILGVGWSVVCPPEHLILWTVRALRAAVARAGFRVLRVRTDGWNPSEVIAHVRWTGGTSAPVNRQQSGIALSEALARTRSRRAAKAAVNRALTLLRLGDTLKIWAVRDN